MADCPKCSHHLRLIDWKQKCPYCGVNMVVYNNQERLMQDADKAEVQYYHFQKKMDRLKSSFVGSKLAIVRIFTSILPIAPLFLPIVKGEISQSLLDFNGSMDIIKLYNSIGKLDFGILSELISQAENKKAIVLLAVAFAAFLVSLVLWLLHFICLTMACSPRGKSRNYTIDIIMGVCAIASAVCILFAPKNEIYSLSLGAGAYIYILLTGVNIGVDIATFIKGIEIHHKQCYVGGIPIEEYFKMQEDGVPHDEIRAEMYRRLNKIQQQQLTKLAEEEKKAEGAKAK